MTRYLLLHLQKIGIDVMPYVVYREHMRSSGAGLPSELKIERITINNARYAVNRFPAGNATSEIWLKRITEGDIGLLMSHEGEPVGYTWTDTRTFHLRSAKPLFMLNDKQAYLANTFIVPQARGRRLSLPLRHHMYAELDSMGYEDFFSISEFFNTPAKKFKRRLGATPLELRLSVELFRRWECDIRVYQYEKGDGHQLVRIKRMRRQ